MGEGDAHEGLTLESEENAQSGKVTWSVVPNTHKIAYFEDLNTPNFVDVRLFVGPPANKLVELTNRAL